MYCIKVTEGRERIEIRKYSSAFLPSCVSAGSQSGARNIRMSIVPGYIFTIRKESKAIPVPADEWQVIEALSDSHPSYIDENGAIISGPLAALNALVTSVKEDRVKIQASLLGEKRTYWIPVRSAAEEPAPVPDPQAGIREENKEENKGENKKMEYTQEQVRKILAEASVSGVHAAAKSSGVPWQTVLRWAREAGTQLPSRPASSKAGKKAKTGAKKPAANQDLSPLEAENAALRERVALLEEKVRKLRQAIEQLM